MSVRTENANGSEPSFWLHSIIAIDKYHNSKGRINFGPSWPEVPPERINYENKTNLAGKAPRLAGRKENDSFRFGRSNKYSLVHLTAHGGTGRYSCRISGRCRPRQILRRIY